jgi:DNA-binding NarL/FixJ family response regulator
VSSSLGVWGPVLIADEDAEARCELARVLEEAGYDVVQASTGDEAMQAARERPPCLAILEIALGERSGYDVCRVLHEELGKDFPVIFLSGRRTESFDRVAGLLLGADDYVVKPYAADELLTRLRKLLERFRPAFVRAESGLTSRELEVLQLLAEGLTPAEIAGQLFISTKTVGTHLEHVFSKLGVRSRAQAVALAYRDGLVGTPS